MRGRGGALALALVISLAGLGAGCTTAAKERKEALYGPTESVLEVVAVLRRHVSADTYRFPPPLDFTGRNVYRSSLLRIESLEHVHADSLRAGHLDGAIAFAKGRSLERLRAYELAAKQYRRAAEHSVNLRESALRSAEINQHFQAALREGLELTDPLGRDAPPLSPDDADEVVAGLEERQAMLYEVLLPGDPKHYETIIREEVERADVARAHYFSAIRHSARDGHLRAVAERQRVITRHGASKNRRRHLLELADLYATIAEEYVAANPPESLRFDPPTFQELVDSASQLYEVVAAEDGTPEKLEAARRFEAFLAFTLQVDRVRFTQ